MTSEMPDQSNRIPKGIGDLGYFSHFPVLAAAVAKTTGPILELGMGLGSTPMLHAMCKAMKRPLISFETSVQWFNSMRHFFGPGHAMYGMDQDWSDFNTSGPIVDEKTGQRAWYINLPQIGVAFIDCSPGEIRKDLAVKLKGAAKFILLHDHEAGPGAAYYYDQIIDEFKYNETYRLLRPHTLILSDAEPFGLSDYEQGLI